MISGSIGSPNELDCHRGNELKIHGTSTSPTVLRPWAKRSCSRARRDVRPAPPKGAPGSLWSRHFFSWCHFCICLLVGWIFTECQRTRKKKTDAWTIPTNCQLGPRVDTQWGSVLGTKYWLSKHQTSTWCSLETCSLTWVVHSLDERRSLDFCL